MRTTSKGQRKLVIGGQPWGWTLGGMGAILWSPSGLKYRIHITVLTGMSWENWERSHWKKWRGGYGELRPSHIRAYLDRFLRGEVHPVPLGKHRSKKKLEVQPI